MYGWARPNHMIPLFVPPRNLQLFEELDVHALVFHSLGSLHQATYKVVGTVLATIYRHFMSAKLSKVPTDSPKQVDIILLLNISKVLCRLFMYLGTIYVG